MLEQLLVALNSPQQNDEQDEPCCSSDASGKSSSRKRIIQEVFDDQKDVWGAGPQKKKQKLTNFNIKQTGIKHFAKRAATQISHTIKLSDEWTETKLIDAENDLRDVVREVLKISRGNAKDSDLGNLIIHNEGLEDIPIGFRPWNELNEDVVLAEIGRVVQSNKDIPIDPGFQITVGSIEIPSGKGRT